MPVVLRNLIVLLFFLGGCVPAAIPPPKGRPARPAPADEEISFGSPCTRERAEKLAATAGAAPRAAMRAASCFLFLAEQGEDRQRQLADARKGRQLAESVAKRFPESGAAHYLAAYLTALEAELDPLRGLDRVPVIEREALLAAGLNPELDHGGPDRLLGELYLRAPGFPLSVGDSSKAVIHYRRALAQDADFSENRLGLAEALLAEEDLVGACRELNILLESMPPVGDDRVTWQKSLGLLKHLCPFLEKE